MLVTCIAMLVAPAQAQDHHDQQQKQQIQEVQLKQQEKAEIDVPEKYEVTLDFKGQEDRDIATWSNTQENNRLEISCGEKMTPSQDPGQQPGQPGYDQEKSGSQHMDKVMLKIEDKEHELASLQNFRFSCDQPGQYVNVNDAQGKTLASVDGELTMVVTKVEEQKQPEITGSL